MKKYVVAYLCFHDNDILLEEISAHSHLEAANFYLSDFTEWESGYTSMEELEEALSNGDCVISVLELTNSSRAGRSGGGLQTRTAQFDSAASLQ